MNIKSLLLGSAAALVAVSGARAADAPVTMVEPEPAEYVRVCDVYGTGFFYIPGTETCLKVGGLVRFRVDAAGEAEGTGSSRFPNPYNLDDTNSDYTVNSSVRGRVNFDAREETELGTLRGYIRFEATNSAVGNTTGYGTTSNGVNLKDVFIQLGGLLMGRQESLWGDGLGKQPGGFYTDTGWNVGDISNNQIRYTFATNGFTVAASVEDDGDGDAIPDVVGKIGYEFALGSVYVAGIYDEDAYDVNGLNYSFYGKNVNDEKDGAFAVRAGAQIDNVLGTGGLFKVEGHYAFEPTEYASLNENGSLFSPFQTTSLGVVTAATAAGFGNGTKIVSLPEEWQVGAGYQQSFGKLTAYVSGIYGRTFDIGYANGTNKEANIWGVAGDLSYDLTKNFTVLGEVSYRNVDLSGGLSDIDQTRGFIQFTRSF